MHGTYAGNIDAYRKADCRIVWAANWPYHVYGDIMDHTTRIIRFDEDLLRRRHRLTQELMEKYAL
jgi:hypothetical protein